MFKQIRNYILNLSIRKKFFLGYIFASILPIFFITMYSYNITKRNLIEQNSVNMQNSLTQINSNIERKLETYSKSSSLIYLNDTLKNYLTEDYTKNSVEDAYYYINSYFGNILILNPDISLVTVYTDNYTLSSDSYYIKHIDNSIKSEKWYDKVQTSTGNVIYGTTYKNSNGNYVFTLTRYLNSGRIGYPYGILVMTINESQLYSLIDKSAKNSYKYIVDENGSIISCRDKSNITKNIYKILNIDKSTLSNIGTKDINYKGKKMLVVCKSLENGWKTISMVSYSSFLDNAIKSASFIFIIFLFSVLLAVVLTYVISAIVTKRINVMVKQVKKVQDGNFNVEFKNMGNDEIGNLSSAFCNMSKKLKFLIEEVYEKELLKKQADMNVLQEQINPHFLYNALASISSLALKNNDKKVNQMTSLLGKFYRLSLNKGKNMFHVSDEIELTQYYIEIQKIRFQNLLNITFELDETLAEYKVPKLILQPFIENSINHGIFDDEKGINIIIKLYGQDGKIVFEVVDDGIGMDNNKLESILNQMSSLTEGFGIKNVNNRIKLYFGDEYGVQIFSKLNEGTQVKIILPMQQC
ncbi:sensor histidine kinase [Clostridium oryzae]|uniref:Sensor histidine kinase YehU n=1 Tax=Clostridium oryzae TaxID=1450648 RepID=A0A1V4IVY3_9CLOT|nr:sensor histidine kinase [Clostridium oryzae]OPJ63990.1 sensor histidine kinase YehU [Clostridium oryzae]